MIFFSIPAARRSPGHRTELPCAEHCTNPEQLWRRAKGRQRENQRENISARGSLMKHLIFWVPWEEFKRRKVIGMALWVFTENPFKTYDVP